MQFDKHNALIVRQAEPFNAGPPLALLIANSVTPTDLFFVRNHAPVPEIDVNQYHLQVDGNVRKPLSLTLADLHFKFQPVTVAATLQCAGNRRQELSAAQPIPGELRWGTEAISHATWTGVRLRDVLLEAGVSPDDAWQNHVALTGLDETEREGKPINFGGSIPMEKAFGREVLLAYGMNGQPLAPVHGAPLRLVVPGYIGARSVKWLSRITVQANPSDNFFQTHAYKLFPPNICEETRNWEAGLMLGETPITSVICSPHPALRLKPGLLELQGYAMAGGNRQVAWVEISADEGWTWVRADFTNDAQPWSWRLWRARVNVKAGQRQLMVRAVDSAANTQPPDIMQIWNVHGYINNAWHRVRVEVRP
jgi:sulfite oxidase